MFVEILCIHYIISGVHGVIVMRIHRATERTRTCIKGTYPLISYTYMRKEEWGSI